MPEKVVFADKLRGLAALSVLISHYFGVFWVNPAVVSSFTGMPPVSIPAIPSYVQLALIIPQFKWGASRDRAGQEKPSEIAGDAGQSTS